MDKFGQPLPIGAPPRVALGQHPLHPMVVTFPIAFFIAALGADVAFWYSGDVFWSRCSLWLLGGGTAIGVIAAVTGTVELLTVARIRHRAAGWSHFVAAVMLLSIESINWALRLPDPAGAVLPLGIYLSLLGASLVGLAGWLGGNLVFRDQVGIHDEDSDDAF